ncbi:HTH-type transcriptional regulator / antitoxin HigA [Chromohalobacter canadensis]|uniref:HTH-type transcriptional regulator / antitoxin HigA n=1 Tax=Chromohalobacter canadensis TaxID=141389 RepID=A0A285VVD7_9GAMM|nr:transcriptional regulator [Chromohalobacter canadensis]SOC58004.1 HTH-type transcriptional regulator / antitoxin HigA [Chromohalobacter canadensis]
MQTLVEQATKHWSYLAPLLSMPSNDADYDARVDALDELLELIGDDEAHPLASLASRLGDVLEAYDEEHRPMPDVAGSDVLRYLMQEHQISQSGLPELGAQSVVSAILAGRRQLNWRQICELSERFGLSTDMFKEPTPTRRVAG